MRAAATSPSMSCENTTCTATPPGGAIYLMIDISAAGMDSGEFAIRLLKEQRVAVAPGSTFGQMCREPRAASPSPPLKNTSAAGVTTICEFAQQVGS